MKKTLLRIVKNITGLLILVVAFMILTTSSQAVYINQGYKKGVAITADVDAMFSSNLLRQLGINMITTQENYAMVDTIVSGIEETNTISFDIYNYAPNMPNRINTNDITYDLTVSIVGANSNVGDSYYITYRLPGDTSGNLTTKNFTDNICTISNVFLQRNVLETRNYVINFPKEAVENGIKFAIKAVPNSDSARGVNDMGLAALVTPVITSDTHVETNVWTGHWIEKQAALLDSNLIPSVCSGYNYELSGTGSGTVTLSWPEALEIDKVFLAKNGLTVSGNSVTFNVDSSEEPVYNIRFYKTGEAFSGDYSTSDFTNWPEIQTFRETTQ